MTKFRYTRLGKRVINWMPFGWNRGEFFWLGPIEYARMLWSRATRKIDPWPERPAKRHLIVPIAENLYYYEGCLGYSLDSMSPERRAYAEEMCRLYPKICRIHR